MPGPRGPAGIGPNTVDITAGAGQTVFPLTAPPDDPSKVLMVVDHFDFYPPDITVIGATVVWPGAPALFNMEAGQEVRIYF